jgi:hypothetical protein
MMNDAQARWTLAMVMLIGGLFGLYSAIMLTYFLDGLPPGITPLFLIARVTPLYLSGVAMLEFCWYVRWQWLSTF